MCISWRKKFPAEMITCRLNCMVQTRKLKIKNTQIVPVIISIHGLIHKQSVTDLKEIGIEINWKKLIKDIVIRNMQDLLYYNGVNMSFEDMIGDSPIDELTIQ